MANKKLAEDVEDIKKSLDFMSQEITKVAKQQTTLKEIMDEFKQLKALIQEKDKKIDHLEQRIDELEQYARLDDLLISGFEIQRSYAQAVAGDKGEGNLLTPVQSVVSPLEHQVVKFFESKEIPIESKNIEACYTLPQRNDKKPNIIIRFSNRKNKMEVLRNARKLRGTGVYVNEHLTKRNAEIAREARMLKKEKKIQDTWTRNCKILIKLNGTPEQARVIAIRNIKELERYK